MSVYTPDVWKVIRLTTEEHGKVDKVLAGWHGGYLGSESWQLNSGIKKTVEYDDRYEFMGFSGSVYVCYKSTEGFSGFTSSILASFRKRLADSNSEAEIEVINYKNGETK